MRHRFPPLALLAAVLVSPLAACDSGSATGPCEPAALVTPTEHGPSPASVAVEVDGTCRVLTETAGAGAAPAEYLYGPDRDWERRPTFLVGVSGGVEDGPNVRIALDSARPPAPGVYPVMDLRGPDGRFGRQPARFHPDSLYSVAWSGGGQGYWYATGGTLVVERVDETAVSGTFEGTYLHGGGGRPLTVRARFHARRGRDTSYGLYANPHGG